MDHLRYQSSQTAASYVAAQLDPQEQEAFELHMMSCPECVGEVESWRAIQQGLPGARPRELEAAVAAAAQAEVSPLAVAVDARPAPPPRGGATSRLRIAVAVAAVALAGAAGGWLARTMQEPPMGADDTAFFALNPVSRGAEECQRLRLDKDTRVVALRVRSTAADQELAAVDAAGRDLTRARFSVRAQSDGNWLARLSADAIVDPGVRFEGRSADGTVEPLGCVVSVPRS